MVRRALLRRPARVAAAALWAGLAALAAPPDVSAQSRSELSARIERLERDARALERRLEARSGPLSPMVASIDGRLSALERLIRGLERRIEALEIAERRGGRQIAGALDDLKRRLTALERRPTPLAPAGAGGPGASDGAVPPPPASGGAPPETAAAPAAPAASASPPPADARAQYDAALALVMNTRDYDRAERGFAAFIEDHPGHALAGNAWFWKGRTYFVRDRFQDAADAFAQGYEKHPESPKAPEILYNLGLSLHRLGNGAGACAAFAKLGEKYPKAPQDLKDRTARQRSRLECP